MKLFRCDKCGADSAVGEDIAAVCPPGGGIYDLCKRCQERLRRWLEEKEPKMSDMPKMSDITRRTS